jgi:heme/copper-type cytochrome/quinol oxidase subunit 2
MGGRYWIFFGTLAGAIALLITTAAAQPFDSLRVVPSSAEGQDQGGATREFTVVGNAYAFSPSSITVDRNDLVKITFTAQDIPHSFTIDRYRIAKRAGSGQSVTFEFRADQSGPFPFYCNLTQDEKCKDMKGTLTVR